MECVTLQSPNHSEAEEELIARLRSLEKRLDQLIAKGSCKNSSKDSSKRHKEACDSSKRCAPHSIPKKLPYGIFPIAEQNEAPLPMQLTLHYRSGKDDRWIQLFSKIGIKRSIIFADDKNNNKTKEGSIVLKASDALLLESHKERLTDEIAIWKALASRIGVNSAGSEQWLRLAAQSIQLNDLNRTLGPHLGGKNFLSDSNKIDLSDLILRSFYSPNWEDLSTPNNIQLWVKRVDDSLRFHGYY